MPTNHALESWASKDAFLGISRGNTPIAKYLRTIKRSATELALINKHVLKDNLILNVLNGIGLKFKEIVVVIQAYDCWRKINFLKKLSGSISYNR